MTISERLKRETPSLRYFSNPQYFALYIQPLRGWLVDWKRHSPSSIAPPAAAQCNMELILIQPLRGMPGGYRLLVVAIRSANSIPSFNFNL